MAKQTRALAKPEPQNGLAVIADERRKTQEARHRETSRACQAGDEPRLWAIVEAYVRLFGRKGEATSVHTLAAYRRGLAVLLEWLDSEHNTAGRKVHQIRREDASAYRAWLFAEREAGGAGLAPGSVNARLRDARVILEALFWGLHGEGDAETGTRRPVNPFANVRQDDPTRPEDKRDFYRDEELAAMLEEADPRERVLVLLGCDAGLRVSEVIGLRWGAKIDLDGREVKVIGKGSKTRKVGLTQRACDALAAVRGDARPGDPVLAREPSSADKKRRDPLSRQRAYAILKALCDRAGVPFRSVHALRHACGTRMYRLTGNLLAVKQHLGHSSVETSSIYAHLAGGAYAEAIDRLGEPQSAA